MHTYEIEIKVLLGTQEKKDAFMERVTEVFPEKSLSYTESQKNHYFEGGNLLHLL